MSPVSAAGPWPPPPDAESLRQLVRDADVEGFIKLQGAPHDEYDAEAEELLAATRHLSTAELTSANLVPILEAIWRRSFAAEGADLAQRRAALQRLAEQIARFFGPQGQPLVRGDRLA